MSELPLLPPPSPFAGEAPGQLFGVPIPLAAAFKLAGTHIGNERARIAMPSAPTYGNSRGDVHGGVLAMLMDCALAGAVRSHDPARFGVATIDLTMHYVAPGQGEVIALAVCERRGRLISFARGEAYDSAGKLLAMATGTFKLLERTA
ncbi:MAG: PaaI family thioesterase [Comamonas sp.]|nr:PaaI family thioesterase [Comamonas sp.]